jgi:hypothetical protein
VQASNDIQRQYTRSDGRGSFPRISGAPEIECNRLAMFWRPMIDMIHSETAPISLRMVRVVSGWIEEPHPDRISWFSRMAIPGLRRQVLRHAGLEAYDASRPADLHPGLRTPSWQHLVDVLNRFGDVDSATRALVVFHLAQLTFCQYAVTLTGVVAPSGKPADDQFAYQVARLHARIPGLVTLAMPVFEELAANAEPLLAYHACFQGIAQAVRTLHSVEVARRFAQLAGRLPPVEGDWTAHMTLSRFHRAMVRLRMAERSPHGVREELDTAWHHQELMSGHAPGEPDAALIVGENLRDLMELEIESVRTGAISTSTERITGFAAGIVGIDPNAAEGRLAAGDGYLVTGDLAAAARLYSWAGELGTTAGAVGWYRAAQCFDRLGDIDSAVNAMGRCLELDTTAVEPKQYLEERG